MPKPSAASRAVFLGGLFDEQTTAEVKAEEERKAIEREARRDPLAAKIMALGLAPSEYALDHNFCTNFRFSDLDPEDEDVVDVGGPEKMGLPWRLPSRLFQFPLSYRRDGEGPGRLELSHPLLIDHPRVQHAMKLLGEEAFFNPESREFGAYHGQWHHAVDLMTTEHWRSLLNTRQFTNDEYILGALAFHLTTTHHERKQPDMTVPDGRRVLALMEYPEPASRTGWAAFSKPHENDYEGRKTIPINANLKDKGAEAWALIHGIEDGVFKFNRGGFLNWTPAGMLRWREEQNATETA